MSASLLLLLSLVATTPLSPGTLFLCDASPTNSLATLAAATTSDAVPLHNTKDSQSKSTQINDRVMASEAAELSPSINILKVRAASEEENASQEANGNHAAEELDSEPSDTDPTKTKDDNDAEEHDDYEDKGEEYINPLPPVKKTEDESRGSEAAVPVKIGEKYDDTWPEMLPAPVALSAQKANGYQKEDGTYVLEDSDGDPCILAYFQAKITLYYPVDGEAGKDNFKSLVTRPGKDATVSGSCDRDAQDATLEITWEPGTFLIGFDYDTLTDSWYVSMFQFAYNTGKPVFVDSNTEEEVVVRSDEDRRFWMTSHARSFRCMLLHDIPLEAERGRFSGTVHFDEVRVQALTYGDRFKPPKHCLHRVHRDEKVPLIVGSTLAGLTVLTIGIYAAIRYFKIKKVQYDTMQ